MVALLTRHPMAIQLTEPQRQFAGSRYQHPAYVGGLGSGKTFAGVMRTISLKSQCVGQDVAYYLPSYPLVKDIALSRIPEMLDSLNVRHKVISSAPAEILIPDWRGKIKFRTMEDPSGIVGYEVAHSVVDELDTLPTDKARLVWGKIIARNRQLSPLGNSVAVVTTPEGFRFVYERWVKKGGKQYRIYKGRTSDNAAHLPPDYMATLEAAYSPAQLAAYLDGEFVNLASGSVYPEFDRAANACNTKIEAAETLHIGMDFNVANMAAVVFVLREGNPHAVNELIGIYDTPGMCAAIKSRFAGHRVMVYPDASGGSRKSNDASVTDLAILRQAGFTVIANPTNPAVKDRVLSVNALLRTRAFKVNGDACPHVVQTLEQQSYTKGGEPDKAAGLDHCADALGYFIASKFPIQKRGQVVVQPFNF